MPLLAALIPVLVSAWGIQYVQDIQHWISQNPNASLLIVSLVSIFTMAMALIPTTIVAISAGFFFGWKAFLPLLICYPLAAILGRFLGLFWFRSFETQVSSKHQAWLDELSQQPFYLLVMSRLSPALPFAMSNILLGQISLSWSTYIWATLIGMLPRSLLSFWIGMQISDLMAYLESSQSVPLERWIVLGLLLLSSLALSILFGRIWRRLGKRKDDSEIEAQI
ncbi:MAG: VTT domain-containing protein [Bacteroidota bacterium]